MAVRVGFEPTEESPPQRFSRPPDSTTLAPHRIGELRGRWRFHYIRRCAGSRKVDKAEIGRVLSGHIPGRRTPTEITVYKSIGHRVQDLAPAWALYSELE